MIPRRTETTVNEKCFMHMLIIDFLNKTTIVDIFRIRVNTDILKLRFSYSFKRAFIPQIIAVYCSKKVSYGAKFRLNCTQLIIGELQILNRLRLFQEKIKLKSLWLKCSASFNLRILVLSPVNIRYLVSWIDNY